MTSSENILSSLRSFSVYRFLSSLLIISFTCSCSFGYMINIEAGAENECFHEIVSAGVKIGFSFEVIDGGFFDIGIEIRDPNNAIIHQEESASSDKLTIEAHIDGPYNFCFSNRKVSYTPKSIIFDIDKSDSKKNAAGLPDQGLADETTRLVGMVDTLLMATISSRHDVRYLTARDRIHRRINESTNSAIVWWSAIEFILLLVLSLIQVWYLKRFFETRRKA